MGRADDSVLAGFDPEWDKPTDVPERTKHECILYRHTSSDPTAAGMHVESYLKCEECGAIYDDEDDAVVRRRCNAPPAGWICTRDSGHDGPCAAIASNPTPAASPVAGGSARLDTATDNLRANPYEIYPELLPCPFCASSKVALDHLSEPDDYFVSCGSCEVQQIASYLPDEAVRRWNQRKQLVPEGWVKVTPETMPVVGEEILFVAHGDVEKGLFLGDKWVSDRSSPCNDEIAFTSEEVTGWRKLPASPAAEEERSSL